MGRSRGGWGTKLSLVTDGQGLPLAAAVHAGQAGDLGAVPALLDAIVIGSRFDRARYRQRNVIERTVGHLKEWRRIATRAEKLATCYLAMVTLGMIRLILRRAFRNTA